MDVLLLVLRLLLVALLYAFLGTVMVLLWRDLHRAAAGDREAVQPGGRLVVLTTPENGEGALPEDTSFPLQPVTPIGRSPSNTIMIPDTYTSAQHALLTWREGQWWLEDRNSRNGTLLNGTRVTRPTVVSAGDVIEVGRTALKLETGNH